MSMGIAVLMLVVAMLVMVMVVIVIAMMMVITVIVRRMIVPGMAVRADFFRVRIAARIGSAFGIERRLDLDPPRAQPLHHRLDDMIAPDAQAFACDLRRQMAVAEMPGDPHQMLRIGPADFSQRLGRPDPPDHAPARQHHPLPPPARD